MPYITRASLEMQERLESLTDWLSEHQIVLQLPLLNLKALQQRCWDPWEMAALCQPESSGDLLCDNWQITFRVSLEDYTTCVGVHSGNQGDNKLFTEAVH